MARSKVAVIGAGKVGATTAQILAYKEICDIVLFDRVEGRAEGVALDLMESAPIERFDVKIEGTNDYSRLANCSIVVITAGVPRKEGMSRDDLLKVNSDIIRDVCAKVKKYAPNSIMIVLTNPLDAMVYLAKKLTGFPKGRIMGMAGILDSARFRTFVGFEVGVSVEEVSALVMGGHGDYMVPMPRFTTVSGVPITKLLKGPVIKKIVERTRDGGAEIIKLEKEGSAFYAPASALVQMIEAILKDKKAELPCSAYLDGEYGIKGIFMGVPVVLGSGGVERIVQFDLDKTEMKLVNDSAKKIKELVSHLK